MYQKNIKTKILYDFSWDYCQNLEKEYSSIIYFVDKNISDYFSKKVVGKKIFSVVIDNPESKKSIKGISDLAELLISLGVDKNALIVGVGGGAISDIVGFLGSIYKRGVDFGFISTTLLSSVDAAIGGKNGINHGGYKNMLGTINEPIFVGFEMNLISNLPIEEFRSGLGEVLKYAIIGNYDLFKLLMANSIYSIYSDIEIIKYLIKQSVEYKIKITTIDPYEGGIRKILNFGHTIGHAIEKKFNVKHGYAIGYGMYYEELVNEKLESKEIISNDILSILKKYEFDDLGEFELSDLVDKIKMDKKINGNSISVISIPKIGLSKIVDVEIGVYLNTLENVINNNKATKNHTTF